MPATSSSLGAAICRHFDDAGLPVVNPLYEFPRDYHPTSIEIDYSSARYDATLERAYFDLDGTATVTPGDHVLGTAIPTMFGKRYYSQGMTRALRASGLSPWPADLATSEEAEMHWPFRTSSSRFPALAARTGLRVMLVFADREHVQPLPDKPAAHQSYDGFRGTAGLWTRLNPDAAYIAWAYAARPPVPSADNPANVDVTEDQWRNANALAYRNLPGALTLVPLAAVAEMADRLHENNWTPNLDAVLVEAPAPAPAP